MKEFFEHIQNINPNVETVTATVVSGDKIGQKAIISDGKIIWKSEENGFFSMNEKDALNLTEQGIYEINGYEVYAERCGHKKKLVICGAGHVSIPIIKIGKMIGMYVTVIEDRLQFANNARDAGADQVICDEFENGLKQIDGDLDTYFVIVTRGHQWDKECLREICGKPHAYIGMMGSRRRVRIVKQTLIEEGIDKEIIESVHSPIGLDIGSETPEEIAVSIIAEIVQVKNSRKDFAYPNDILDSILGSHHVDAVKEKMMMATIIARKGSAPREVGTKMLILADGRTINTIGGGCVEAGVITKARQMLMQEKIEPEVIQADLTADEASLEGEVCGGVLDILMEEV